MIRSLYLKIFLWFWLAMIVVSGTLVFSVMATQRRLAEAREDQMDSTMTPLIAAEAARIFEQQGKSGLQGYFRKFGNARHFHPLFYDSDGREILGQSTFADADAVAQLAEQNDVTHVRHEGKGRLVGQRTSGPSGTKYVLVLDMRDPPPPKMFDVLSASPAIQMLRFAVVLLAGGLVCFWLARHITAPIRTLRTATRQLAYGKLEARVGEPLTKRQDELADLSRDFDEMAERIQALLASQQRLMGDISHELRSPLARLSVALGLARRQAGPEATAALDRIERETERLNELIGNLLQLSRLESGAAPMGAETVELDGLVREVAEDANFEAQSRNRKVRVIEAESCAIAGSRELVRSAVENVVRNALKYTAEGTDVEVSVKCVSDPAGENGVIRIRDHGEGVPEDALEDIFRPFYRVADSRERSSGGTGLGLTITERAMRVHGGQVKAQNSPAGGLVVELRLPVIHHRNGTT